MIPGGLDGGLFSTGYNCSNLALAKNLSRPPLARFLKRSRWTFVAAQKKTNRHSRTRSDHATELAEDYVEAIADLIQRKGTCRAVDLAEQFHVSHVTVNRTVGRLQRDGFVTTEPYAPIELTPAGQRLAEASKRRHEIVFQFLVALGVSEATATIDSEGIEHHVSEETLQAMQAFVDGQAAQQGP